MDIIEYIAAGGIIIHHAHMLLLDRPARGEVRLPKGHVDPGEAVHDTALRETAEETGYPHLDIVADLGSQVVEFDYQQRHYRRTEHYYLLRLRSEEVAPRPPADEQQFRPMWVPMHEAVARLTFPTEQDVARRAITAYLLHQPPTTA